jgi:hypothetical protein
MLPEVSTSNAKNTQPVVLVCPEQQTKPKGLDPNVLAPYVALFGILAGLVWKWRTDVAMQKREMKRSAYMEVTSSITACVQTLAKLADPTASAKDLGLEFASQLSPLSRAQVVAGPRLSRALIDLTGFMQRTHYALVEERMSLDPLHQQYEFLQVRFKTVADEIDGTNNELSRCEIEGADAVRRERLLRLLDSKMQQREQLRGLMQGIGSEAKTKSLGILRILAKQMQTYPDLLTSALGAIRKELGFPFEPDEFLKLQRQANELAQELVKQMVARAEAA